MIQILEMGTTIRFPFLKILLGDQMTGLLVAAFIVIHSEGGYV